MATSRYVRVYAEPSVESTIRGHIRSGSVAEILSISPRNLRPSSISEAWYEVQLDGLHGWAYGSGFDFYESQSRAANASGYSGGGTESQPGGNSPGVDR